MTTGLRLKNYVPRYGRLLVIVCAVALVVPQIKAQDEIKAGKLSLFGGGGGSITFGSLYERARYGAHGTLGAAVLLAPGNTEAFELAGSATGSYFPNDGKVGGDFLIATGGLEFRLVANLDHPAHYFFGLGGGMARVRERFYKSRTTGNTVDGFIEWAPYFAPGLGIDAPIGKGLRFFSQAHYVTIFGNKIGNYKYLQILLGVRL